MNYLIFFIVILLIIVVWLAVALGKVRREEGGTVAEKNKEQILDLFKDDAELTNTEIREALGVSSRTAVRYMDALEKAGLVRQTRPSGPLTAYILKK